MSRIDRYFLAQLLVAFGFFSLVLILVYWVNRAVILFDQLIGDGQSMATFLLFSALALPSLISIVLPIAAFAAGVYVANRMTSDSELIVLRATGTSSFRMARPVLVFGLIVGVLMSALVHVLVPAAATELDRQRAEIAQNATARLLQDGQFLSPTDGVTFYVREITDAGELRNIFLSDNRGSGGEQIFTASSAYLIRTDTGPQLVMIDGMIQSLNAETSRLSTTAFGELSYDIGTIMRLPDTTRRQSREVPTLELLRPTEALATETGRSAERLFAEAHERVAQSLLPVIGALIGFAALLVGQFSRFGVWRQIIGAILLVIIVKGMESAAAAQLATQPGLWPLAYVPSLTGAVFVTGLVVWSMRPRFLRRALRRATA
ncbi:LPS export ABC transporter permease LptF [Ponticoccus sp. SC2-23]|uniref:LPS export ABC transporter permease LptF n=1 Tax=Alexandriicola marinus TaxID=2081710 RepID=UPI000FD9B4C1|nr:LPS export ABC transporter permease LptF [Alexandriicola marinus]MBM1219094.1 LPS export ABC transporter permease LptF [Ponticoccus sp. SC6-9]MBM1223834.1 LPS export ABC transporter permease LptF [Ponticoccus sp. SC6-15]MBM1228908.1 LPS export ABC transporter permease LptF [Ponticoccus sp. SC6-38]MBM1232800.1 LPS export ABC transporter permease LptF [Ponticoccus sp. SC6-45]MBM1237250.1 LPS export ABC transporter permease LptF [Ponticoccus sp. SC6-49]MBM1241811.1 LPS export ABC transporter 